MGRWETCIDNGYLTPPSGEVSLERLSVLSDSGHILEILKRYQLENLDRSSASRQENRDGTYSPADISMDRRRDEMIDTHNCT